MYMKVLFRKLQIPIILVTHSHEDALFLAERLVIMIDDRIEQLGTVEEITRNPKTPFTSSVCSCSSNLSSSRLSTPSVDGGCIV
jgi:ABC-type Fe3+/spermidine/putrescine transport system ATPase subunit